MAPNGNQDLIDLTYLRTISQDPEFLRGMITTFLEHAPVYLMEMQTACENSAWDQLSLSAHKLKPSATYMGIKGLLELINAIELQGKHGEGPQPLGSLVRQALALCEEAYPLLRKELG